MRLDPSIDLVQIAARFELGGGAIMNVVRYACLDGVAPQWRRSLLDRLNWSFHWAGVVMKAGSDNITLENYAIMFAPTGDKTVDEANVRRAYDFTNTEWVCQVYGTVKTGQSFHEEHLRSSTHGTHGTRGTTLRVKT